MRTVLRAAAVFSVLASMAAGCSGDDDSGAAGTSAPAETTSTTAAPTTAAPTTAAAPVEPVIDAACAGTVGRPTRVSVQARPIVEASGLAASVRNPGLLWTQNDSGDIARMFALNEDGRKLGTFELDNVLATDWEDIALGPLDGADDGNDGDDGVYVADIGDNNAERDVVALYRVAEPEVAADAAPVPATTLEGAEWFPYTYPDGPRDSEALFIDRTTDSFFVIEKSLDGGPVGIYRGSLTDGWSNAGELLAPTTLERVGTLTLDAGAANAVTSADMIPSGGAIAVRTYGRVLLWDRPVGTDVAAVLASPPCEAPVPAEVQGEAITILPDGSAYVTLPEGATPSLSFFTAAP